MRDGRGEAAYGVPMTESAQALSDHERDMIWEKISDLEHRGWRGLCDGSAGRFFRDLMDDDALMVTSGGEVLDREGVRDALQESEPWTSFEILEEKLLTPTADVAILIYCGVGHRSDGTRSAARLTSVYLRDESRYAGWRLINSTRTPMGGI